jgi:hypothetical protein
MALQGRSDPESHVATIAGDETRIAEYFVGEVLREQSPDVLTFLRRTSILDAFTPELAQVLTGRSDARRTLATLERENGFVQPVDHRSTAYRYHRLFAELLRAQLATDEPEHIAELHRRAANWFAARGRVAFVRGATTIPTAASNRRRRRPPASSGTRSENAPSSARPRHSAESRPLGMAARTRAPVLFSSRKRAKVSRTISCSSVRSKFMAELFPECSLMMARVRTLDALSSARNRGVQQRESHAIAATIALVRPILPPLR